MSYLENHKTFIEHLEELRKVIFRILLAITILLPALFFFADDAIGFLVNHSCPPDFTLRYFSPMEPLFVKIKISLLAAIFVGLPYIAYTLWQFIVPALYPKEQQRIKQLAVSSWILFIAGGGFCFLFIIPAMMRFSLSMQSTELEATIGLSNYIGLVGMLLLGFGIMFQLPIIIFFLVLSGMIKLSTLKKQRAIILIIILVLSALLTPPDIFSQIMMAVPTYLLFELSLIVSAIALRTRKEPPINTSKDTNIDHDNNLPPTPEPALNEEEFYPATKTNNAENYNKYYRPHIVKRKLRSRTPRRRK